MQSINPATGLKLRSYKELTLSQTDNGIKKSHRAFEQWRRLSIESRGARMKAAAVVLRKNKEHYARLMANEMGKPVSQGWGEIEKCAWVCEFYADQAKKYLAPQSVKTDAKKSYVAFEPLGVILAVMPWNFPFWQVFRCAAPTLMAGNTIVLKHASNVSGCALAIDEVFKKAGFPDGVFKTLLIPTEKVAFAIEHPLVQAVTLTGSTGAGQAIASRAGSVIKKCVLELGGSDAYIVLKDADLGKAAATCVASRFINGGQSCVSAKRFIVVRPLLKEFERRFVDGAGRQRMGSPLDETTTLGPLARRDLRDSLHVQVQKSVKKGARLLLGGEIPDGPGAFYPPTVLTHVRKGMPAYDEEFFGPVASIIAVADEKEAIAVANDTVFGLGAAVFSRNVKRAEHLAAHELQAGCCFVNDLVKSDPRLPFGGIKQSGYGRELSNFGMYEFMNIKTVSVS